MRKVWKVFLGILIAFLFLSTGTTIALATLRTGYTNKNFKVIDENTNIDEMYFEVNSLVEINIVRDMYNEASETNSKMSNEYKELEKEAIAGGASEEELTLFKMMIAMPAIHSDWYLTIIANLNFKEWRINNNISNIEDIKNISSVDLLKNGLKLINLVNEKYNLFVQNLTVLNEEVFNVKVLGNEEAVEDMVTTWELIRKVLNETWVTEVTVYKSVIEDRIKTLESEGYLGYAGAYTLFLEVINNQINKGYISINKFNELLTKVGDGTGNNYIDIGIDIAQDKKINFYASAKKSPSVELIFGNSRIKYRYTWAVGNWHTWKEFSKNIISVWIPNSDRNQISSEKDWNDRNGFFSNINFGNEMEININKTKDGENRLWNDF